MSKISIQSLIESGVHFGHSTSRWNPKMSKYIYSNRNAIHILDLRETVKGLLQASSLMRKLGERGAVVIFVGTKKAAKELLQETAEKIEMPYAAERWLGGTFTNFTTIRSRVKRLDTLETIEKDGTIGQFSKKIIARYGREKRKLIRNLGGIRAMKDIPACMVVIDPKREKAAVAEANRMNVPVISLTDTDSDPDVSDIVIPGNDDAVRSIRYVLSVLADAYLEGQKKRPRLVVKKTEDGVDEAKGAPASAESDSEAAVAGAAKSAE